MQFKYNQFVKQHTQSNCKKAIIKLATIKRILDFLLRNYERLHKNCSCNFKLEFKIQSYFLIYKMRRRKYNL